MKLDETLEFRREIAKQQIKKKFAYKTYGKQIL
jgi:hypothetical protein